MKTNTFRFRTDAVRLAAMERAATRLAGPAGIAIDASVIARKATGAYLHALEQSRKEQDKSVEHRSAAVQRLTGLASASGIDVQTAAELREQAERLRNPARDFFGDAIAALGPVSVLLIAGNFMIRDNQFWNARMSLPPIWIIALLLPLLILGIYAIGRRFWPDQFSKYARRPWVGSFVGGVCSALLLVYLQIGLSPAQARREADQAHVALATEQLSQVMLDIMENRESTGKYEQLNETRASLSPAQSSHTAFAPVSLHTAVNQQNEAEYKADLDIPTCREIVARLQAKDERQNGSLYCSGGKDEFQKLPVQFEVGTVTNASSNRFTLVAGNKYISLGYQRWMPIKEGNMVAVAYDSETKNATLINTLPESPNP